LPEPAQLACLQPVYEDVVRGVSVSSQERLHEASYSQVSGSVLFVAVSSETHAGSVICEICV
jgi:hypothetical protein